MTQHSALCCQRFRNASLAEDGFATLSKVSPTACVESVAGTRTTT
jgi:hypothetical protein